MNTLTKYIDDMNRWNAIFGMAPMTLPLSQKDADALSDKLSSELSPENLHCDGEISQAEAQRKYNYYGKVIKELENYCLNNWLNTPVVEEYY